MAQNDWRELLYSNKSPQEDSMKVGKDLLQSFMNCWSAGNQLREKYFRCKRFVAGDQWSDNVKVGCHQMTEGELLEKQGKPKVTNNFLKIFIRNYVGAYVKQDVEAICSARGGEKQKLADALSILLQYNWDLNSQKELNASVMENGMIAPCFVAKVGAGMQNGVLDVYTDFVDFPHFIVDPNMKDPRGRDVTIIGEIHDLPKGEYLAAFAETKKDRERLSRIYEECNNRTALLSSYRQFGQIQDSRDFLCAEQQGLCRVFEIWTKQHRNGYYCHDYLSAEGYSITEAELDEIKAENASRVEQARAAGVSEEDIAVAMEIAEGKKGSETKEMPLSCKLIKPTYFYEDYWYYRFITANGVIIKEGESPYEHGSHPYVFRFYPMLGGDARSIIEDILDLQKDVNRMDSMYEWIMRLSAKGALLFPKEQMCEEDGWTLKEYANEWSRPDGVIPYHAKAGFPMPQQVSSNNTNIGLLERINTKMDWIQRIIGIEGPLQGRSSFAGQSGTMYAQQVEQGTTSLMPLLNTFSAWTKELATKQAQCIQQYYEPEKILSICSDYGLDDLSMEEIKDVKSMPFYVRINESKSSFAYKDLINQRLDMFLQMGLIDRDIYLKNTTLPFDWKIRRDIEQQAQVAMQTGGQPLPSSIPQQASQAAIAGANNPQAGANNLYNQLNTKQQ